MQQSETSSFEMYSRRPAAVAALSSLFVFALSANALPAVLLRAAESLSVSIGSLAQVSAVQFGGFLMAAVAGGMLADHIGKKRVMQAACGLLTAGAVTWGLATGLFTACTGAALMGLGGGIIESMSSAVLSDMFPDRRKFFLNLSQAVYCTGAIAGSVMMSWLLPLGISWRVCFAGIAAGAVGLAALYSRAVLTVPAHDERIHFAALQTIIRRRTFLLPCLALFLYVLTESGVIVYGNVYLQTVQQAPERWAIAFLSLFWFGMMMGRWVCVFIPERVPYAPLTATLLTAAAAALVLQQWANGWIASLFFFTLTGAVFSGTWPLIVGMTASLNSGFSGTVLGLAIAVGSLGCIAAPSLMNTLFAHLPAKNIFPVTALHLLLAALALLFADSGKIGVR